MSLSRRQCNNIKGWAIIFIALANMFRHVIGLSSNEMAFSPAMTSRFTDHLTTALSPIYSIGFLGWYGVVLFLFLSGYGLELKYGKSLAGLSVLSFLRTHVVKLWRLMVPLMLLYVAIDGIAYGNPDRYRAGELLRQALFVINITDYEHLTPGTYWFFGLIIQFYVAYALVLRHASKRALWCFALAGFIILYCNTFFSPDEVSRLIRHNLLGWITPFALGILMARTAVKSARRAALVAVAIVAAALFIFTATLRATFPLSEVLIIIALVALAMAWHVPTIAFVGRISGSVFVIYPIVQLSLSPWLKADSSLLWMTAIYLAAVIAVAAAHYFLLKRLSSRQIGQI